MTVWVEEGRDRERKRVFSSRSPRSRGTSRSCAECLPRSHARHVADEPLGGRDVGQRVQHIPDPHLIEDGLDVGSDRRVDRVAESFRFRRSPHAMLTDWPMQDSSAVQASRLALTTLST